jgi:Domain of unknown function DUF11
MEALLSKSSEVRHSRTSLLDGARRKASRGACTRPRRWWFGLGVSLLLGPPSSFALGTPVTSPAAASSCPSTGLALSNGEWLIVQGDCTVEGNITLSGASLLIVTDSHFVLTGNLTGSDQAIVYVQRSDFTVNNRFNSEWSINMFGDALLWFSQTVFRSNMGTDGNHFMGYFAHDRAKLRVVDSSVPTTNSWLLGRIIDQAQAYTSGSNSFPSEIVVAGQATIQVQGGSQTSIWMPFDAGSRAMMVLPDQTQGSYSFSFGRNTPNVAGVGYQITIIDSFARLGISSSPGSAVAIIGKGKGYGAAKAGEISIGYLMPGVKSPELLTGLRPGYQAYTRLNHQGRTLILYNVELDPVGWNVYVSGSQAFVTIRDSILNEVAAFPAGKVEVQKSILQWAVLGSTGSGSQVIVRNSNIYSQVIHSAGNGRIEIHDSVVHGSPLEALDDSTIQVFGGLLSPSGSATPCNLDTGLTPSAVPLCNPFIPPGVDPVASTSGNGQVLIDGIPPTAVADMHLVGWTEPEPVALGGLFTYHVQTGNAGPDPATGVWVRLRTPVQASVDSFSPTCLLSGRDVICKVGSLALYGASNWLTVTYRALSALTPAVGEATVVSDQIDPDPSNHTLRLTNTIQ